MSDQGRWFRLWCSALQDPDLDNLSIADFGRWAKLGMLVKEHGSHGTITVTSPCRMLCTALQVETFEEGVKAIFRMPNVVIQKSEKCHGEFVVTFLHWRNYQEDQTVNERKRKERAHQCHDSLPEKGTVTLEKASPYSQEFIKAWSVYPRKTDKGGAWRAWKKAGLGNGLLPTIIEAIQRCTRSDQWKKDGGQYIPYFATWLNGRRWEDEPESPTIEARDRPLPPPVSEIMRARGMTDEELHRHGLTVGGQKA